MERVSLYIPCYNAKEYINECLHSVMVQSYKIDEVLVIDDGSDDNTIEIAKRYPVKIIRHDKNRGLAASRNTAFRVTKNEFVASLDADCVAGHNWLQQLMECFVSDDIMGVGGKLVERHNLTVADKWRSTHMSQQWGNQIVENPPFLFGSNTVFKKKVIEGVGFYNEKFRSNYEDVDISIRIYNSGFRLIYNSEAEVEHLRKDTIKSVLSTYWHWLHYKHMGGNYNNKISRRIAAMLGNIAEYFEISEDFFQEDLREKTYKLLPFFTFP